MKRAYETVSGALCLLTGAIATGLSIVFSYKFFVTNGHEWYFAGPMAFVYVVFLNLILFDCAIRYFLIGNDIKKSAGKFSNKKVRSKYSFLAFKRYVVGGLLLVCWAVFAFYSAVSTVGGQYEQFSKIKIEKPEDTEKTKSVINENIALMSKQKRLYENELKMVSKRLSSIQNIDKSYEYKNTKRIDEERMDILRKSLEDLNVKILNERTRLISIELKINDISSGSFYHYIKRITNIPAIIVQFVLSLFPSIVFDVFSPVAFSMFWHRKKL